MLVQFLNVTTQNNGEGQKRHHHPIMWVKSPYFRVIGLKSTVLKEKVWYRVDIDIL